MHLFKRCILSIKMKKKINIEQFGKTLAIIKLNYNKRYLKVVKRFNTKEFANVFIYL